ncbi:hypothetical protein PAXRUDRAFT_821356 [Paxillus rubicundulus Ve08.2h10]|uniref:Uncharacterized protein n=1 Tax=Paxillus rubicundulus Ve08.2h10 TaxID=930991 RepID=A0A0D0EAX0_9AGAM|nr:hypothetical protein PAXRUDRAFT_821356 [Paxillus rubicundulus Ve08.2h10]
MQSEVKGKLFRSQGKLRGEQIRKVRRQEDRDGAAILAQSSLRTAPDKPLSCHGADTRR